MNDIPLMKYHLREWEVVGVGGKLNCHKCRLLASRTARGLSNLGLFQRLCGQHPLPLLCQRKKMPKN